MYTSMAPSTVVYMHGAGRGACGATHMSERPCERRVAESVTAATAGNFKFGAEERRREEMFSVVRVLQDPSTQPRAVLYAPDGILASLGLAAHDVAVLESTSSAFVALDCDVPADAEGAQGNRRTVVTVERHASTHDGAAVIWERGVDGVSLSLLAAHNLDLDVCCCFVDSSTILSPVSTD